MLEKALRTIDGGIVLDVATQAGHFAKILRDSLRGYRQIIGIDLNARALGMARDAYAQADTHFLVMDAEQLGFADDSFNAVSISASFHHLADIQSVLWEMKRALKPGGHFIIIEMHSDGRTPEECTSIDLHHWLAEVDTASGRFHKRTLARQEFLDYAAGLGLRQTETFDITDRKADPRETARIEALDSLIDRVLVRTEGLADAEAFIARGQSLRRRLHEVGALQEPILLILGKK